MGLGVVLIVWLIFAVAAACAWLFCLAIFVVATWKRWRIAQVLFLIPLVGMPLTGLALGVVVVFLTGRGFYAPLVYREEFHEPPTSDVRELTGYKFGIADGANCYLRFIARPESVAHLVAKAKFQPTTEGEFRFRTEDHGIPPHSWSPFRGKPTQFYVSKDFDRSFPSSTAYLSYDPATGVVHFAWEGFE